MSYNVSSARIQSYSQSNSISFCPLHFQYSLTLVSPSFFATSIFILLITYLYLEKRLISLNFKATSAKAVLSVVSSYNFFFSCFFSNKGIFQCNYVSKVHSMLLNLQFVFFFVCLVVESFKKVLMRHLGIRSIEIYYTTIISNIVKKLVNYIEFRVVKDWLP